MSSSHPIREVARLLKVKPYVVRYWEQEVPLIQVKRDTSGRHCYSDRDIQILIRLKYLLYERKFTVQGAVQELYRELSGSKQDLHARIAALRKELLDIYFSAQDLSTESLSAEREGPHAGGKAGT